MRRQQGFALLAALWLLVALSAASLALGVAARTRRLSAANYAEGVRARAAAQAGVEEVRALLEDRIAGHTGAWWSVDSLVDTIAVRGAGVTFTVRDVGLMLNLNRADEAELRRLFVALRVEAGDGDRLAQAIADWRDSDDLHRPRGAEQADYLAAQAPTLPRNGPFQRIEELRAVQGMTPELFDDVRRYLTIRGSGQVNLNLASRPVLLTVPGLGEEAVAALLRLRREGRVLGNIAELERELSPTARAAFTPNLPMLLARATTETREIEVTSEASLPGSPVRVRATGVFVRARDALFHVWSSVE